MKFKEQLKEVKERWLVFALFGIFYLIISAGVSTYISTQVSEGMQGDPCRIDFPVEEFTYNKLSEHFSIEYLLINLRDKDLQIEGMDAYCYWKTEEEMEFSNQDKNSVTQPPLIDQISTPKELDKVSALSSEVKTSNCKSPDTEGLYKIRVIARTTQGNCQGEVLMEVKK